ncbi:guided entry of tail-anchored proteins factor 1-like [Homalodisca vitripennis]|uniref:guided entry of tail-anchored proteins factor 1-like n=1 Tax=Homalodisca vitripennis TaxID=197043 RepID=UPI001EECA915|nr:guided entry of tail-anchored proteins factor 1-like [Homalodisca vitripennis]XP_046664632.1 guided entry of tail-anchored proteins factor 1-like [Homalodisca vitripennis]XP_046664633.1 guided entry of tail-anchored proteins factor 1-like [Homalodisca vitripennis]
MDPEDSSMNVEKSQANAYLLLLGLMMSVMNNHLSTVLNYVFIQFNKLNTSSYYHKLKTDLSELQKDSFGINMTEEFAKYARLQRKIIKIQAELKTEALALQQSNMTNKMILQFVMGVVSVVLVYMFNAQPVVHLSSRWLYPVSSIMCWPGIQPGAISFLVWCAITNSVIKTFS